MISRSASGTWPPARSSPYWTAIAARSGRWPSPPMAPGAVSGSGDGAVRIWDLTTETEHWPFSPATTAGVLGGRSPPDGTRAVTGGARRDGAGLGPGHRARAGHADRPQRLGVTRWRSPADGRRAVSGGEDGTVRVWDLATGPRCGHAHRPHRPGACGGGRPGRAPARSPAAATGRCGSGTWPPGVSSPAPAAPAPAPRPQLGVLGGGDPGWHPGGHRQRRRVAAGLGPGARPGAHAPSPATAAQCWSVAVTEDGAPGGQRQQRQVGRGSGTWPPARRSRPHRPHRPVWSVAVTPDGTRAVSGSGRRLGAGLGPGAGPRAGRPHRPHLPVLAVASQRTAPARSAAAATGGAGRDLARRRMPGSFTGRAPVYVGGGNQDGTRAVSGSSDGSVRVWDLAARPRDRHPHRAHPPGAGRGCQPRWHPGGQRRGTGRCGCGT